MNILFDFCSRRFYQVVQDDDVDNDAVGNLADWADRYNDPEDKWWEMID